MEKKLKTMKNMLKMFDQTSLVPIKIRDPTSTLPAISP
jgi:hypothetical protein